MNLAQFLAHVVTKLDECSSEPRTTRDIDIVLQVRPISLRSFFAAFDRAAFYIDSDASTPTAAPGQMFNLIELGAGWKVDLVVVKDRPFSRVEFARRQQITVLGCDVLAASAEDVLLAKLEWSKAGGSSRQLEDARGIVAVQGANLDRAYLQTWAAELGVSDLLGLLLER
jgi:hypothetical protein